MVFLCGIKIYHAYFFLEKALKKGYSQSYLHYSIQSLYEKIEHIRTSPEDSLILSWSNKKIAVFKKYLKESFLFTTLNTFHEDFCVYPSKAIGIILTTTVLTHLSLSFILGEFVGLWGKLIQSVSLVIGFLFLFSNVSWDSLKKNSFFSRKLKM